MTRQLLRDLPRPEFKRGSWRRRDEKLFLPEAVTFYTEHSPRNVVPSLAAALEVPRDRRDFLGRWAPSQSDDYVRTQRAVVTQVQLLVADAVRRGGARVRQEETTERLQRFLAGRGVGAADVEPQLKRLKFAETDLLPAHPELELPTAASFPDVGHVPSDEEDSSPTTAAVGPFSGNDTVYIITYPKKRAFRRLHLRDGCHHARVGIPGAVLCNTVRPSDFDAVCVRCWPDGRDSERSSADESASTGVGEGEL